MATRRLPLFVTPGPCLQAEVCRGPARRVNAWVPSRPRPDPWARPLSGQHFPDLEADFIPVWRRLDLSVT
jgi:hypothetical protein